MKTRALLFCGYAVVAAVLPSAMGQGLDVICSLEQPLVAANAAVSASVLVGPKENSALHYKWKATAGKFQQPAGAESATVSWAPEGAATGDYKLSVTVTGDGGASGSCSVSIAVGGALRSEIRPNLLGSHASRDLLVRGRSERPGYGLYSYILISARPDPEDKSAKDRDEAVLKYYLLLDSVNLESKWSATELNATYVPVTKAALDDPPDLSWIVKNYDYDAASRLIAGLPEHKGDGPYLISCLDPLSGAGQRKACLVQDLSTVPVSVIPLWMKLFRSETTQQRVWDQKTIGTMSLNLRTGVAIIAEALGASRTAVSGVIVLTQRP